MVSYLLPNGSTIPSSIRNPHLTLLSSRIQRRFNMFGALVSTLAIIRLYSVADSVIYKTLTGANGGDKTPMVNRLRLSRAKAPNVFDRSGL